MLHDEMVNLTTKWRELEDELIKVEFEREGMPLAMKRFHGKMRLLYNGKPIVDCKMSERIDATRRLNEFIKLYHAAVNEMADAAVTACQTIDMHITKKEQP